MKVDSLKWSRWESLFVTYVFNSGFLTFILISFFTSKVVPLADVAPHQNVVSTKFKQYMPFCFRFMLTFNNCSV